MARLSTLHDAVATHVRDGQTIVIGGLMMGKTAATISKRPNGYSLAFVEGMTKPKVNGETVKDSVRLKEFDTISIGSVTFQFIQKK